MQSELACLDHRTSSDCRLLSNVRYRSEPLRLRWVCQAVVGVAAGVFPAWKAARLDPIEALRAE